MVVHTLAMAILTYTQQSEFATHLLAQTTYRQIIWNLQMFPQRDMALEWLENQQQKLFPAAGNDVRI